MISWLKGSVDGQLAGPMFVVQTVPAVGGCRLQYKYNLLYLILMTCSCVVFMWHCQDVKMS